MIDIEYLVSVYETINNYYYDKKLYYKIKRKFKNKNASSKSCCICSFEYGIPPFS